MKDNQQTGRYLYGAGDTETRSWFERQWRMWPERAEEHLTTNVSLHYGGVQQYRIEHECDPAMSPEFAAAVARLDRYRNEEQPA